ncbi:MAG: Cys-tRNA(Pro) deacylase [Candidatus Nanopelagicales bacterium]
MAHRPPSATPALRICEAAGISYEVHTYAHQPGMSGYGTQAAQALGVSTDQLFKTLIVDVDGEAVCVVVPVSHQAAMKAIASAHAGKHAELVAASRAERLTGYVLGAVSPLGQRTTLPTYLDQSAVNLPTIYVSAGKRGRQVQLDPMDLHRLTHAVIAPLTSPS